MQGATPANCRRTRRCRWPPEALATSPICERVFGEDAMQHESRQLIWPLNLEAAPPSTRPNRENRCLSSRPFRANGVQSRALVQLFASLLRHLISTQPTVNRPPSLRDETVSRSRSYRRRLFKPCAYHLAPVFSRVLSPALFRRSTGMQSNSDGQHRATAKAPRDGATFCQATKGL